MSSRLRDFDRWVDDEFKRAQWTAHDKPGGQAAQRRLKQRTALEAKQRRRVAGVDVDAAGRTPAGLIVPGFEPKSRVASMGGGGR